MCSRLQPYVLEAATLCVPGLEGGDEALGENSAPPPAAAAEAAAVAEAGCQEVRCGHAHQTRTKRAPRALLAPHVHCVHRCAPAVLAGRAPRS